jgi:hypothetical protein
MYEIIVTQGNRTNQSYDSYKGRCSTLNIQKNEY